jgi:hypothetical protein
MAEERLRTFTASIVHPNLSEKVSATSATVRADSPVVKRRRMQPQQEEHRNSHNHHERQADNACRLQQHIDMLDNLPQPPQINPQAVGPREDDGSGKGSNSHDTCRTVSPRRWTSLYSSGVSNSRNYPRRREQQLQSF